MGSNTPMVLMPSPSQSPTTGLQPGAPYWKGVMSGAPGPMVFLRYQVAVAGSKTPIPSAPSPSQSPTSAIQPGAPKANGAVLGAPGELLSRRYQVPVSGSKTPTVVLPRGVTGIAATETVKVTASFCCGSKGSLTRTVTV